MPMVGVCGDIIEPGYSCGGMFRDGKLVPICKKCPFRRAFDE